MFHVSEGREEKEIKNLKAILSKLYYEWEISSWLQGEREAKVRMGFFSLALIR